MYVDEQGRTHDGSGNAETKADRLKNRRVHGTKDSTLSGQFSENESSSSETVDGSDDQDTGQSENGTENRAKDFLAVTGISSGFLATVLLALVSLLGAFAIIRRGKRK